MECKVKFALLSLTLVWHVNYAIVSILKVSLLPVMVFWIELVLTPRVESSDFLSIRPRFSLYSLCVTKGSVEVPDDELRIVFLKPVTISLRLRVNHGHAKMFECLHCCYLVVWWKNLII